MSKDIVDVRVVNAREIRGRWGILGAFWGMVSLPFRVVKSAVDFALSLILLAFFVTLGLWAAGVVPDEAAVTFVTDIGDRVLVLAKAAGLPL